MFSILKIKIFPVEHNPFDKFVANRLSDHSMRCVGEASMPEVQHILSGVVLPVFGRSDVEGDPRERKECKGRV
jgi:hypothetical protein